MEAEWFWKRRSAVLNQNVEQERSCRQANRMCRLTSLCCRSFDTAFSMMDMEEENALKEFLVGHCVGRVTIHPIFTFMLQILPVQNLVENMVDHFLRSANSQERCNQITMGLLLLQLLNHMDRMETERLHLTGKLTGSVFNYIEEHYKNGSLSSWQIMDMTCTG